MVVLQQNKSRLIKSIMLSKIKLKQLQIRAFTMLESLLVLGLVSLLALGLSSSVQSTFAAVEEQILPRNTAVKPSWTKED